MAAAPTFAVTPRLGTLISTSSDTAGTATAAIVTGNSTTGTDILLVRAVVGPTTAPGGGTYVDVVIDDGANKTIIDSFSMVSVTVGQVVYARQLPGWTLPTSSYSLKLIHRTTLTPGSTLHVTAMVKDY